MEWASGNIFIRPNTLTHAGAVLAGHTHNFDHTTIVFSGAIRVYAELPNGTRIEKDFAAPAFFLVRADVKHTIEALADNTTFWCIYSHRDPQGKVVQEMTGFDEAYR